MNKLSFIINGTQLTKKGVLSDDLRLNFKFEGNKNNWKKCKVVAVFERNREEYAAAIKADGTCLLPEELRDSNYFRIKVIVKKEEIILETNTILITKGV